MKRVMLLGDSIRMYYEPTVRELLADEAAIWTSGEENAGTSRHSLSRVEAWVADFGAKIDIIHVNCGLHDLAKDRDKGGQPRVPVAEYEANVGNILKILQKTGARVIWATVTPVNEWRHSVVKDFDRLERDANAYHAASLRAAMAAKVAVNDLHGLVMNAGRDWLLSEDGVHFTSTGSKMLGAAVARAVRDTIR